MLNKCTVFITLWVYKNEKKLLIIPNNCMYYGMMAVLHSSTWPSVFRSVFNDADTLISIERLEVLLIIMLSLSVDLRLPWPQLISTGY